MDFDTVAKAGSRLGTGGIIVFDEGTCLVAATLNLINFFARESCGWCTPCREGLPFVQEMLARIEREAARSGGHRTSCASTSSISTIPSAPWRRGPWGRWRGC